MSDNTLEQLASDALAEHQAGRTEPVEALCGPTEDVAALLRTADEWAKALYDDDRSSSRLIVKLASALREANERADIFAESARKFGEREFEAEAEVARLRSHFDALRTAIEQMRAQTLFHRERDAYTRVLEQLAQFSTPTPSDKP